MFLHIFRELTDKDQQEQYLRWSGGAVWLCGQKFKRDANTGQEEVLDTFRGEVMQVGEKF